MTRPRHRWTQAALLVVTTGCVTLEEPDYPAYWPAVAVSGPGCPSLTGRFDNRDINEAQPVLLAKWLLQTADPLRQVHRVQLAGPEAGTLVLRLLDDTGTELLKRELREGTDYACGDGWLERKQPELAFVGVVNRHLARLARTTRGDLVVQDIDQGGGVVLVVPMYASFRQWHLYRQRSH